MDTPELLLFDGATGSGKSSLLSFLRECYSNRVHVGTKVTTRNRREGDNEWEFSFVTEVPQELREFSFTSVGHQYAVDVQRLVETNDRGLVYAMSCVDRGITQRLRGRFSTIAIYVYRPWLAEDFDALLKRRGVTDVTDVSRRRVEVASVCTEYARKIDLFDHVILNIAAQRRFRRARAYRPWRPRRATRL
jgi:guanylate kinase